MKIKKYCHKPTGVQAVQWKIENWDSIRKFVPKDILGKNKKREKHLPLNLNLEGESITVPYGDYIVKDIKKGKYYVVKSDVFRDTYVECKKETEDIAAGFEQTLIAISVGDVIRFKKGMLMQSAITGLHYLVKKAVYKGSHLWEVKEKKEVER